MRLLGPTVRLFGTATAVNITNETTFGDLFDDNPDSYVAKSTSPTSHSPPATTRSTWTTYNSYSWNQTYWAKSDTFSRPVSTSTHSLPGTTSIPTLSTHSTAFHISTTPTAGASSSHTTFSHSSSTSGHTPTLTPVPLTRFPYPVSSGIAPDRTFRCTDPSNAAICNIVLPPWITDSRLGILPDDPQLLTNITLKCETTATSPLTLDVMGSLGAMHAFPDAWKCAQMYESCTEMMANGTAKIGVCGPTGWGLGCGVVAETLAGLLLGNCEVQGRVGGWLRYEFVEGDLWYFAYSAV